MTKSTITAKYQTTVPKGVREKLGIGPNDILPWEVFGDHARVKAANLAFLEEQGSIKVGPGDVLEDIRKAREMMGIEDYQDAFRPEGPQE
jgi:AbrB family looped-hinge helix DNA binding protein